MKGRKTGPRAAGTEVWRCRGVGKEGQAKGGVEEERTGEGEMTERE